MKTKFILTLTALICLGTLNAQTQEKKNTMEPTIRDVNEMHLMYYEFTGPYEECFTDFGKLMQYIQTNSVAMGPYSIGVYYDDPEVVPVNELRSEVGYLTNKVEKGNKVYKTKTLPAGKAVSLKYNSMDDIYPAYGALAAYIAENNLETESYSVEVYYSNDPSVIDAEILMYLK